MDNSYFKYFRNSQDNEFYFSEKFTRWSAWVDLLTLATFKERTVFIKGNEIKLKAGDLCYSQRTLAKRWKWNVRTVTKFLQLLHTRQMIHHTISHITTVITILNWKLYQNDTSQSTSENTSLMQHRVQTNKKDKKVKECKEKNIGVSDLNLPIIENINFESYKHLNDKVFRNNWNEFKEHRVQIKKRLSVSGENQSLKYLDEFKLDTANKMLEQSIRNGWQGIFELKNNQMRGTQSGTVNHSGLKEWAKENGVDFNF